jgi:hypothetical protein
MQAQSFLAGSNLPVEKQPIQPMQLVFEMPTDVVLNAGQECPDGQARQIASTTPSDCCIVSLFNLGDATI